MMTCTAKQIYEVKFGKQRIPFKLETRDRTRLAISVHPDRSVTVVAPENRTLDEVLDRVQKRAAWIVKQRSHFDKLHPLTPPRRYVAGETHLYLGRQYRLKLLKDNTIAVRLAGRFFCVHQPDRENRARTKELLESWYREHAKVIFERRMDICLKSTRSLDVPVPELVVRKMTRRWGSCTKAGRILLNTELVKTPLHCIEYVIMHELCHLKIHNHSPEYYRLLTRCMPDWERRKQRLEGFLI